MIAPRVSRSGIFYYTPADFTLIHAYYDKLVTIESTSLDISLDVTLSRAMFINELKKQIEYFVGRLVSPHIFGGGAQELLGGPTATDMDIRISRTTFQRMSISEVQEIVINSVALVLWHFANKSNRVSFNSVDVARIFRVKAYPRGDSVLIKVGNQIDISVTSFFGKDPLSSAGVDGFSYDFARCRFSCVAGTIWCNRAIFLLNLQRLNDREYIAASPIKIVALFSNLVHKRAHAFSVKASDVTIAKRRFKETEVADTDKEIWQCLLSHFRGSKDRLVDLMTALSFLKNDPDAVKKYAHGWVNARALGIGFEAFLGELVEDMPDMAATILDYLYGFFLLECAFSQKQEVHASEFLISGKKLMRPMFSIVAGERVRYIPLRDDNGPFPTPIQIINNFLRAKGQLTAKGVNLDRFKAVLHAFEFDAAKLTEDALWHSLVTLWLHPKIQKLQNTLNPEERPQELLHALLDFPLKPKLQYLIFATLERLDLASKLAAQPDKLIREALSLYSIDDVTDEMSHLSLSQGTELQPKEFSFACENVSLDAEQAQRDLAVQEYLKTTVQFVRDKTVDRTSLKNEFNMLWDTLKPCIKSDRERELLGTCIVEFHGNCKDKRDLRLGMNRCIDDVMEGSDVALKFLDILSNMPEEDFEDGDFLQDIETLFRVACRRHLRQKDGSCVSVTTRLCNFLLSTIIFEKPETKVSRLVYEFIKEQFYFVVAELDQAKEKPLNLDYIHALVKALSLHGARLNDFESLNRCFFISKSYTPSQHIRHSESMKSFAETNIRKLPRAENVESQERCFQLIIRLFPFFNELVPELLVECLKKLKTCHLNATTLALFYQILHLVFEEFKNNPKLLVELIIKNMEISLLFPLREATDSAVSLLEKLHATPIMLHIDDSSRIVQMHINLTSQLYNAVLKRGTFEEGEGLLDRYFERAYFPFRSQIAERFKKEKAFHEQLVKLNSRLKQFAWMLSFMPHWFRWFCLVDSKIIKGQQKSMLSLELSKQLALLKAHEHLLPDELKDKSENFRECLLTLGLPCLRGLTEEQAQELPHKANSGRLLNQSLRLLKVAFESQIGTLHIENKPTKTKKTEYKEIQGQWEYILKTIEKTFEKVLSTHEPLKTLLLGLKAQIASRNGF